MPFSSVECDMASRAGNAHIIHCLFASDNQNLIQNLSPFPFGNDLIPIPSDAHQIGIRNNSQRNAEIIPTVQFGIAGTEKSEIRIFQKKQQGFDPGFRRFPFRNRCFEIAAYQSFIGLFCGGFDTMFSEV